MKSDCCDAEVNVVFDETYMKDFYDCTSCGFACTVRMFKDE